MEKNIFDQFFDKNYQIGKELVLCKYVVGMAFYCYKKEVHSEYPTSIEIFHLLTGKSYFVEPSRIMSIKFEDIPINYIRDACVYNKIIREYCKKNGMLAKHVEHLVDEIKPELRQLAYSGENTRNNNNSNTKKSEMSSLFNLPGMNLDFGKLEKGRIAMSFNGNPVFRNKQGEYVSIESTEEGVKQRVDVGNLKMDIDFYKIPSQEVVPGDIILLDNELLLVEESKNDGIKFVNPLTGNKSAKLQRTNIFGAYFYTKIVSLFNLGGEQVGFGVEGLNPLTLMLLSQSDSNSGDDSFVKMMIMSQMAGNKSNTGFNPMMLAMLSKNGESDDLMKMMFFANSFGGGSNNTNNLFGNLVKPAEKKPVVKAKKATTTTRTSTSRSSKKK